MFKKSKVKSALEALIYCDTVTDETDAAVVLSWLGSPMPVL